MRTRVPLAVGDRLAQRLLAGFREYPRLFSRVEIAGSIRRKRPDVGDVEIVALAAPNCRPESVRTYFPHFSRRLPTEFPDPHSRSAVTEVQRPLI
jgi:DNA polymerase/3'-5' exonuclease PolX